MTNRFLRQNLDAAQDEVGFRLRDWAFGLRCVCVSHAFSPGRPEEEQKHKSSQSDDR